MNTLQFMTACLTLVFLSCIFSQALYESDYQQYTVLNRKSKDIFFPIFNWWKGTLLNEKTSYVQKCIEMKDSYHDSLILNNLEQTPNCGNIHFFEYCIFLFFFDGDRVFSFYLKYLFNLIKLLRPKHLICSYCYFTLWQLINVFAYNVPKYLCSTCSQTIWYL